MGLLTDPGAGRGKFTQLLVNYHGILCILLYLAGIVMFLLLACESNNAATYFSENALLPGLVKGEYNEEFSARDFYKELLVEAERHPDDLPYSWLLAKLRQIGLDAYTHNFTLNYPMGLGTKYTGKNVYGIIRAPRSASTEALVLSVPYRPLNTAHPSTLPGVALSLSLAKFFRRKKYWAKDVIVLFSQHEQLGVQAWLEAYHQTSCGRGVLDHGDLQGRAGAIQAAINLELHAETVSHLDIKVEGLNGQLPNLDLVNLAHRMSTKEGVHHTFKNTHQPSNLHGWKLWQHSLKTLLAMVGTQAAGVPNGNHGLFHRFGIEAITIEGFEKYKHSPMPAGFYQVGRVMEGIFRSLNNLLERFHQSFFFYLLPSTERYVSIGLYMPCVGLMAGALLIKAFATWLKLNENTEEEKEVQVDTSSQTWSAVVPAGVCWLLVHALGVSMLSAAETFSYFGLELALMTEDSVFYGFLACSAGSLFIPLIFKWNGIDLHMCGPLLHIAGLLELLGVLRRAAWMLLHPMSLLCASVMLTAAASFPGEPWGPWRAIGAAKQALMFSIVDNYVYGSWMLSAACALLLPTWIIFWSVLHQGKPKQTTSTS
ncbi:hypothetical protein B566_EDAN009068 [Ephemera danica]|nr:hypothetical protein B566_EDAN009068 [Ephemera danica]